MTVQPRSSQLEQDVSTLVNINTFYDTTATLIYAGDISSGVTQSGTSLNLEKFSHNTIYIDVTSTTVNAQSTGLTLFAYSRATSTMPWILFLTNSNLASAGYIFNLAGSGGTSSGASLFRHVLLDFANVSSSATALANIELLSKALK